MCDKEKVTEKVTEKTTCKCCGNCKSKLAAKLPFDIEAPLVVQNFAPEKALLVKAGVNQFVRVWHSNGQTHIEVNGKVFILGE